MHHPIRFSVLLASALLLASCDRPLEPGTAPGLRVQEPLVSGIHAVLVAADQGRIEIRLQRAGVEEEIASYQGELRFDSEQLRLKGARLPEGVVGAWHEPEPGRVQFAGVVLDGLAGRPALVLEFAGKARADQFSVALQEVTARESLQDLTARVQPREHPLWVRQVER